jgi:hypothetical protein
MKMENTKSTKQGGTLDHNIPEREEEHWLGARFARWNSGGMPARDERSHSDLVHLRFARS